MDLKKFWDVNWVLLATTKIGGEQEDLKDEINRLAPEADEIWSVGSDICLTSLTRAKCGTRSTLCWKNWNISGSIKLFAL